ncbi:hypothetical protein BH09VER1_BH09VER1_43440 [soil metagenome]
MLVATVFSAGAGTPTPPPARDFSKKAALAEAASDMKSGHLKIYLAGGIALTAPGLKQGDDALVAKLPRDTSLPSGCTAPHAPEAFEYATIYNEAIVAYLRGKAK